MTTLPYLSLRVPRLPLLLALLAVLPPATVTPRAFCAEPREELSLRGHTGIVRAVLFSPDGRQLYSAGKDGAVKVWDVASGKLTRTLTVKDLSAVALSPDGKVLATGSKDGVIRLWDVATGKQLRSLTGPKQEIAALAFHPAGRLLASGTNPGPAILWDPATGLEKARVRVGPAGEVGAVWSLAFSPDGKTLAIGTHDETVLWDLAARANVASLENTCAALSVAFTADGKTLAVGTVIGGIQLWDMTTKKKITSLGGRAAGTVECVAFRADGKTLVAVAMKPGSKLWDVPGRKPRAVFSKDAKVACAVFTPDGRGVVTGSRDGVVKVWKLAE
jgi:WD40 repeat protein